MAKVLNAVFGIGIAVVVFILILLGIQAFYPEPRYDTFCNQSHYYAPVSQYGFEKCYDNITVGECRASSAGEITANEKEMQKCSQNFDKASRAYNRNFFIITSSFGVIAILTAFFLLSLVNISAGIASAGIVLIMVSFIRGWESTDDKLKFAVGLVIAALVITLAVIVNKKLSKKQPKPSKKKR